MLSTTRSSTYSDDMLFAPAPRTGAADPRSAPLAARRRTPYRLHSAMVVCTECGRVMMDEVCGCTRATRPRMERGQWVQILCAAVVAVAFLAKVFAIFLS